MEHDDKRDDAKASIDKGRPAPAQNSKLRRLVFGALIANGAVGLGLIAVSAQAHGNASSHNPLQLSWNFDNFVIQRENLLAPDSISTDLLRNLDAELTRTNTALDNVNRSLEASPGASLAERTKWLAESRRLSENAAQLRAQSAQTQARLALRPLSREVLNRLEAGDASAAFATIESAGSPQKVLDAYSAVQLDLRAYGAVDGADTPALLPEIEALTKAAIAYQQQRAPDDLGAAASLLHNLASSASPDRGSVTEAQTKAGLAAAEKALQLRKQIGEKDAIAIAEYMVGVYRYKAGDTKAAAKLFADSATKLEASGNKEAYAWSSLFLGMAQSSQPSTSAAGAGTSDAAKGKKNIDRARTLFAQANNTFALDYIAKNTRH